MEFVIIGKGGSKYAVQDSNNKQVYTVKKKSFGQKFDLLDKSHYNLYSMTQVENDKRPAFQVIHNDAAFMTIECKSLFVDPTLIAITKGLRYEIASKDRKNFDIILDGKKIGHIAAGTTGTGESRYDFTADNNSYEDYLLLFAVAIDKAFGEFNRQAR